MIPDLLDVALLTGKVNVCTGKWWRERQQIISFSSQGSRVTQTVKLVVSFRRLSGLYGKQIPQLIAPD